MFKIRLRSILIATDQCDNCHIVLLVIICRMKKNSKTSNSIHTYYTYIHSYMRIVNRFFIVFSYYAVN